MVTTINNNHLGHALQPTSCAALDTVGSQWVPHDVHPDPKQEWRVGWINSLPRICDQGFDSVHGVGVRAITGTMDYRLFQRGRTVRVRAGSCTNGHFDITGETATLGRPRGQGRFEITLADGRVVNVEGKYLEFVP